MNTTLINPIVNLSSNIDTSACTNWCKDQIRLIKYDSDTAELRLFGFAFAALILASIIYDYSEKITDYTKINEEYVLLAANLLLQFCKVVMAATLVYYVFIV